MYREKMRIVWKGRGIKIVSALPALASCSLSSRWVRTLI